MKDNMNNGVRTLLDIIIFSGQKKSAAAIDTPQYVQSPRAVDI